MCNKLIYHNITELSTLGVLIQTFVIARLGTSRGNLPLLILKKYKGDWPLVFTAPPRQSMQAPFALGLIAALPQSLRSFGMTFIYTPKVDNSVEFSILNFDFRILFVPLRPINLLWVSENHLLTIKIL